MENENRTIILMNIAEKIGRNPVRKHTRFGLSVRNEQVGAGRDDQTRLAKPNSWAETGTGKYSFSLFS